MAARPVSIALLVLIPLASAAAGCAAALHESPSLEELTRGRQPAADDEVRGMLADAERLFARRTLGAVRDASEAWLRAAAASGVDARRVEALIGAARAQVWITDHEPERAGRKRAGAAAVRSAQWCGIVAPLDPACSYWLGVALGVQARERPSTALSALPAIERSFLRAAREAPDLDEAGPERALAMLYVRAPGWPAGPGDPDQGLEMARKAVELKPDHPPNHLALAEALEATGERQESLDAARRAVDLAKRRLGSRDPDAEEWVHEAERFIEKTQARR